MWLKKELITKCYFDKFIKDVTLASTCIFLLAILGKSELCWPNLSLESNLTPNRFSQPLLFVFFILKLFTVKLTSCQVLTRKWLLLSLPFKRLFWNYMDINTEARSRVFMKSSTFSAEKYRVFSSPKLVLNMYKKQIY